MASATTVYGKFATVYTRAKGRLVVAIIKRGIAAEKYYRKLHPITPVGSATEI
jgi:hypothetical protein